jgi:DNA replicative helicase MCM subunit Mcm2 (Cdc46/Mcm family)
MIRYPKQVIPEYSAALYAVAGRSFPSYKELIGECFFKIAALPLNDSLRKVSHEYLRQLMKCKNN